MEYDVVIVGAGPAGLAAAIRLKQLAADKGAEVSVCVLEKGSEVGAHILSGACLEPRSLDELLPDWRERGAPLDTPVTRDEFLYLTETMSFRLPTPPQMHNEGNYIVSLGNVVRWLGEQAEAAGVEIYPGFAAAELLQDETGRVGGVATGNMGVTKAGEKGPNFQPGMELHAKLTLLAEGCRGSLTKIAMERFNLREGVQPQTYGLGVKELWEVEPARHVQGEVIHTVGWPMRHQTYGGSWLYMFGENLVSVGFVVGLDYENPYLSPFEEMQRYKTHPAIRRFLEGGRRIAYGARALSEGGFQSIPKLVFPGGALIGDTAGFLNVPKIKGTHTAMKSGMVAAEAAFAALLDGAERPELDRYPDLLRQSWLWDELYRVRNIRPAFHWGLWPAMAYSAVDTYLLRGRAPWTLRHKADHAALKPADQILADQVPQARRQAHLRPALLGLPLQHQPRGGPTCAPQAARPERRRAPQPAGLRRPRAALLPGRSVRVCRQWQRRKATADQRPELRPLQDLRHQGPDPEHRLGDARGRRRAELHRGDVRPTAASGRPG